MLKALFSLGGVTALGVYAVSVLWNNSACDRVDAAAAPAQWVGKAYVLVMEPFKGYSEQEAQDTALKLREGVKDFIARYVYSREHGWQHLCATDPIAVARQMGLTDHRDLLRKSIAPEVAQAQMARAMLPPKVVAAPPSVRTSQAPATPAVAVQEPPQLPPSPPEQRVLSWGELAQQHWAKLVVLAMVLWFLIKVAAHDNKAAFVRDTLMAPINDLTALLKHLLPRKMIKPALEHHQTDKTQ